LLILHSLQIIESLVLSTENMCDHFLNTFIEKVMHIKSILYFERNIVPSGNFFWMFLIESECTDWVEIHRGFAGNNPRTPGHM